jgi:hypothetical protein
MFAPTEPVIDTAEDSADASAFWKPETVVASPMVWSAMARLTVVAVLSCSVLTPLPASIEISVP